MDVLDTLVEEFPDRVRLATWDYLPRRPRWLRVGWAAEIAAVFHIKAFAIDDEVIVSELFARLLIPALAVERS